MTRILFICHGNICRSIMAQCVMTQLVKERGLSSDYEIDSAAVSAEELGNPIYPPAARKLREKGVEILPHRARQMTRADHERFDLVVFMERYNLSGLRRITGGHEDRLFRLLDFTDAPGDVADPWYTGDYETAYQDILRGCRALLDALA